MTRAASLAQIAAPSSRAGAGGRHFYGVAIHHFLITRPMPRLGTDLPCEQVDPELFFPPANDRGDGTWAMTAAAARQAETAKAVCTTGPCPALDECLAWAVEQNVQGIWGGTTDGERARMRRALNRNRRTR